MNENNLPNIDGEENTMPVNGENTEPEAVEEAADDVSFDEIVEEAEEFAGEVAGEEISEEAQEVFDYAVKETACKGGAGKIVAIVIVIIAVLAAAGYGVFKYMTRNPYNDMGYNNVSGRTIKDVAEQAGYASVEEFLAEYGLPADMPEDTDESAAYYSIPARKIAEMYGMDVASLKEMLGLGDDVTEDTPWGEAEGKATLGKYIGEENLDAFKEEYGLGEDVTADTLWSEVRNTVDKKTLEMQQEAQKAAESQNPDTPAVGDDVVESENADGAEEPAAE